MKSYAAEGCRIADQIEGFRHYLGVAEEDRLNALNPPEKTPELFERFLPYAIALDVENAWAKRIAGVPAAMAAGEIANDCIAPCTTAPVILRLSRALSAATCRSRSLWPRRRPARAATIHRPTAAAPIGLPGGGVGGNAWVR
jgi:Predicted membrane protein (DUF2207)